MDFPGAQIFDLQTGVGVNGSAPLVDGSPIRTYPNGDASLADSLGFKPGLSSSNGGDHLPMDGLSLTASASASAHGHAPNDAGLRPRQNGSSTAGRFVRWTQPGHEQESPSQQQQRDAQTRGRSSSAGAHPPSPAAARPGPMAAQSSSALRIPLAIAGTGVLMLATFGALLLSLCLYMTVRPWSRAHYRRMLCAYVAAPLVDAAALLLPRTRVCITGDGDMLDGLCPGAIVGNKLVGKFAGLEWWIVLLIARAVGAHGHTKILVKEQLGNIPCFGWLLRLLECPLQDTAGQLRRSLESFAEDSAATGVPYLFLQFPEGEAFHRASLNSSLDFARREGRPQLNHLLLPHTPALTACIDGLRGAHPVVYDITMAQAGYNGDVPEGEGGGWEALRTLVLEQQEVHVCIKRFSLGEVMGNAHWLDDRWAEKERLLTYFARHKSFPADRRGFPARRALDTRGQQFEGSAMALLQLTVVPFALPVIMIACVPMVMFMAFLGITWTAVQRVLRAVWSRTPFAAIAQLRARGGEHEEEDEDGHPLAESRSSTPWWFGPTTPLNTPVTFLLGGGSSNRAGRATAPGHGCLSRLT